MTQGQEWSNGDDAQVRNLAAVADDLLERAAAVPAGRAALTLVAGAGAPLKQTMLALRRGQHLADTRGEQGHRAAVEALHREGRRLILAALRQHIQQRQVVLGGGHRQR